MRIMKHFVTEDLNIKPRLLSGFSNTDLRTCFYTDAQARLQHPYVTNQAFS